MKQRRGFTLVEVLITVFIIGILFAITSNIYAVAEARSRDQQRLSNLDTINNALEQYHLDNHAYPSNIATGNFLAKLQLEQVVSGTVTCGSGTLAPHYLPNLPEDPQFKIDLTTLGSDCNVNPFGGYLYISNVTAANAPVQAYYLMARMERTTNMSPSGAAAALQASSFGSSYWGAVAYGLNSRLVISCDAGSGSSQLALCTQNFFKANNPN